MEDYITFSTKELFYLWHKLNCNDSTSFVEYINSYPKFRNSFDSNEELEHFSMDIWSKFNDFFNNHDINFRPELRKFGSDKSKLKEVIAILMVRNIKNVK